MLNLVTVVGENIHMLPHMLNYYKDKVDDIFIIVYKQDKKDLIEEEIRRLGITPYKVVVEPKYNWERVTELYNSTKSIKPNDWWIVADDDEIQVYPDDINSIVDKCNEYGYSFVSGGFLDRIGPTGSFPVVNIDTDINQAFPLGGFFRYPLSGACPNKVTLMKGYQRISSGQHYAIFEDGTNSWGKEHPKRMPIQECFTQVHHFKWDYSVIDRIKKVSEVKESYSYWEEYSKMYNAIVNNNFKIDINNPNFFVDNVNSFSYLDYKNWNLIRDIIVEI